MMHEKRFDPKKLDRLNDPDRLAVLPIEKLIGLHGRGQMELIVDLGAGTALFSRAFAEKFPESRIMAFDISPVMVEWMRENVVPDFPNIHPYLMADHRLDLPDDSVDLLFMVNLHHELDDVMKTLAECRRVLKKGSLLAISDWRKEEMEKGPPVAIRVDGDDVLEELRSAGFKEVRRHEDRGKNYLITAFV